MNSDKNIPNIQSLSVRASRIELVRKSRTQRMAAILEKSDALTKDEWTALTGEIQWFNSLRKKASWSPWQELELGSIIHTFWNIPLQLALDIPQDFEQISRILEAKMRSRITQMVQAMNLDEVAKVDSVWIRDICRKEGVSFENHLMPDISYNQHSVRIISHIITEILTNYQKYWTEWGLALQREDETIIFTWKNSPKQIHEKQQSTWLGERFLMDFTKLLDGTISIQKKDTEYSVSIRIPLASFL